MMFVDQAQETNGSEIFIGNGDVHCTSCGALPRAVSSPGCAGGLGPIHSSLHELLESSPGLFPLPPNDDSEFPTNPGIQLREYACHCCQTVVVRISAHREYRYRFIVNSDIGAS
jgi:hypothetical protein